MTGVPRQGLDVPLVARKKQLRTLTAALGHVRSSRAAAVLLSGDAGVGKSRLLAELEAQARDAGDVVLTGRCLEMGEATLPYLPFVEVIGQLADTRPELVARHPALRRLLPGTEGSSEPSGSSGPTVGERDPANADGSADRRSGRAQPDRELGQLQLFDAVLTSLSSLAAEHTVLLSIEDLHWADRSSRDLLAFVLSRLGRQRLLVVCTLRSDDLHRRHPLRPLLAELTRLPCMERLHLEPFTPAETQAFVRRLSDEPLPDDLVERVVARSEGNAFMAEELLSAASEHVPRELAEILLGRVEQLSPTSQQVVRLASVIGRRFAHRRLAAAAQLAPDDLDLALREAVAHHVIVAAPDGDSYAFRHALLCEAVYSDLLPGERSGLHGRVAKVLAADESPGSAAELSHHSLESHDLAGALAASVLAVRDADRLGAPAEMLIHAERALHLWPGVPDAEQLSGVNELKLMQWAAWSASASGEPDRAIAYSRSAIALADQGGDRLGAADIRRLHARYLLTVDGNAQPAFDAANDAWRLVADDEPSAVKAWVQAQLARTCSALDRVEEAGRIAAEAMATARAVPEDEAAAAAEADALVTHAILVEYRQGRLDDALDRLDAAIALAGRVGWLRVELRAQYTKGRLLLESGRLSEALVQFDAGGELAASNGLTWSDYGLEIRVVAVVGRFMIGDWDGAAAAAELASEAVSGLVATRVSAAGLLITVGRGDFDLADRRLARLRERWSVDIQVMRTLGLCGAELESWRGRPAQAAAWIERALNWLRPLEPWHLAGISLSAVGVAAYADLAHQARRTKDGDAERDAVQQGERLAADAAETFVTGGRNVGRIGPEGQAWMRLVEAETARLRGDTDPAPWRAVVEAFGYGECYRQAQARWRLAEMLLTSGGRPARDEAAEQLHLAASVAAGLGAEPLRRVVARLARRARISLPDDRPAAHSGTAGLERTDGGSADGSTGIAPVPSVAKDNRAADGRGESAERPSARVLTAREHAVLGLVATGRTNRQVGEALFISEKTVSVHLSRVMAKLGATSRTEAVNTAHTAGLLDPPAAN